MTLELRGQRMTPRQGLTGSRGMITRISQDMTGRKGRAPAWTPTRLGATLRGWWDAQDVGRMTLAGANLTDWSPSAGGVILSDLTAGAARPAYGASAFATGIAGLTMPGGFQIGNAGAHGLALGGSEQWVWLVMQHTEANPADGSSVRYLFSIGAAPGAGGDRFRAYLLAAAAGAGGDWEFDADSGGTPFAHDATGYTTTIPPLVLGFKASPGGGLIRVNGAQPKAPAVLTPLTGGSDLHFGSSGGGTQQGDFGDIIITGPLPPGGPERIEGYLAWKYGLAADLPTTHPYRAAAPLAD